MKMGPTQTPGFPAGAIVLGPEAGRSYPCGSMRAVFKADGEETGERYSVSEWWLEPHSDGPGSHAHADGDELFYVVAGCVSFLVGTAWVDAAAGSFLRVPAGVDHDFANRTGDRAGLLNVFTPGGFEKEMPAIVEWYRRQA
jgi:mannose-6-phosphate isomerase-like protein (cupin superfamily)